jgi:hypothetical protein
MELIAVGTDHKTGDMVSLEYFDQYLLFDISLYEEPTHASQDMQKKTAEIVRSPQCIILSYDYWISPY